MNGFKPFALDGIVDWRHKPHQRKNASSWLENNLRDMYENTKGPYESPDPVECFILNSLAKNSKGNILEIGSWRGRSSCFLAQGIKESRLSERHLHCIDWFKGDSTGGAFPDLEAMKSRIEFFGLSHLVTIHNTDMFTFNYDSLQNTDLVFYDSDHNTEPTTIILNRIHSAINQNAIVCLHDASWEMTRNAISNVKGLFRHIVTMDVWEGFAILEKI